MITTTGTTNVSPSTDEAKLGRTAETPPANADLSPDRLAVKLGRGEGVDDGGAIQRRRVQ
jgi:hypothetical protein